MYVLLGVLFKPVRLVHDRDGRLHPCSLLRAFCIALHVSRCKVSTRCRIYGTLYLAGRLSYQSAHTPLLDIATLSTSVLYR